MKNLRSNFNKAYLTFKNDGIKSLSYKIKNRNKNKNLDNNWIKKFIPNQEYFSKCREEALSFSYLPKISIIIPTYNTPESFLHDCIKSVLNQTYQNIELCIGDDCSSKPHVKKIILEYAKIDPRIKHVFLDDHNHIVGTTNAAIEVANGEFLAFMDHDDTLLENAIFEVVKILQKNIDADIIYSNEDKIDENNSLSEPCFKPKFDLEYFLSFMYIGHLSVYRKQIVEEVGRLKKGTEGSQDYDLALRVLNKTKKVIHIPKILYHWRKHEDSVALRPDAKPYAYKAMQRVLSEGLNRISPEGKAWLEETEIKGLNRPRFEVKNRKKILILINKDSTKYSRPILEVDSKIHDLIICTNEGKNPTKCKVDFISKKNNYSDFFRECTTKFRDSDFVLCLDNDLRITNSFIDELVEQGLREEIGCVSAKIEDSEGTCMYGGYSINTVSVKNNFSGFKNYEHAPGGRLSAQRSISATGLKATLIKKSYLNKINLNNGNFSCKECFEIALSIELKKVKATLLWTPFIKAISKKDKNIFSFLDLTQLKDDYKILTSYFDLNQVFDNFYPECLDRNTLDFSIDLS